MNIGIIEDHTLMRDGTVSLLRKHYPESNIIEVQSAEEVLNLLKHQDLNLLVVDISIPEKSGEPSHTKTGIMYLKKIMRRYPKLNISVLSGYTSMLVRIRREIDDHMGGFSIANKYFSDEETLKYFDCALDGNINISELKISKVRLEVQPIHIEILDLAFVDCLQDKAIAERLNIGRGTVRYHWERIYEVLGIDKEVIKESNMNLRSACDYEARRRGLIDI